MVVATSEVTRPGGMIPGPQVAIALIVGKDDDEVRPLGCGRARGRRGHLLGRFGAGKVPTRECDEDDASQCSVHEHSVEVDHWDDA